MAFKLKVIGGPNRGQVFELKPGLYAIGRDADNAIALPSGMVSRRHAELKVGTDQVMVRDLGSANGTLINHRKISEQMLDTGDKLFVGDFVLELISSSTAQSSETAYLQAGNIGAAPATPGFLPTIDWKVKLLGLLALFLLCDHFFIANMFASRLENESKREALKRAVAITQYLAEKNRIDLAEGNEDLLDTDSVMSKDGVLGAFIANKNARILSPTFKLNQVLKDQTSLEALKSDKSTVLQSDPYRAAFIASPHQLGFLTKSLAVTR